MDRKTEVSRWSSFPTAMFMGISAGAYASLDMALASTLSAIGVLPWLFLALYRPIRSRVTEDELGRVAVDMAITEHEWELVQKYREVLAQGFQSGGTVGCGGCPSAGTTGPEIA